MFWITFFMVSCKSRLKIFIIYACFFSVNIDAKFDQRPNHCIKSSIFIFDKILDALDAGQLVFHRLRNLGLFEVDRDDRFLALGGEGEFLDDILRLGGVGRDG